MKKIILVINSVMFLTFCIAQNEINMSGSPVPQISLSDDGLWYNNKIKFSGFATFTNEDMTKEFVFFKDGMKNGNYKKVSFDKYSMVAISQGKFINDFMTGIWKYYYDSGELNTSGEFINGDGGDINENSGIPQNGREGTWVTLYKSGQIEYETTFIDGKANGPIKRWYKNGKLLSEGFYKNGNPDGLMKQWYENGQLYIERFYKNGDYNGPYKQWDENGTLFRDTVFKDGVEVKE